MLYTHWQTFETRHGDAKDVLNVMNRYRKYSLKLSAALTKSQQRVDEKTDKKDKGTKKRVLDKVNATESCVGNATKGQEKSSIREPLSKRPKTASDDMPASDVLASGGGVTSGKVVEEEEVAVIIPGKFTLFIKNIDFSVTQQDLEDVFKYCNGTSGDLVVRLTTTTAGKSRGMAHIDFPSLQRMEQAMLLHNTVLKGRPMTVERYVPSAYATADFHPLTVFLNHMSRNTSEEDIKAFLRQVMRSESSQGETSEGECDIFSAVKLMKCKRSGNSKVRAMMISNAE
jgi:hypothetical protein